MNTETLHAFLSPTGAPSMLESLAIRRSFVRWQVIQELAAQQSDETISWIASHLKVLSEQARHKVLCSPDCGIWLQGRVSGMPCPSAEIALIGEVVQHLDFNPKARLRANGSLASTWQPFGGVLLRLNDQVFSNPFVSIDEGKLELSDTATGTLARFFLNTDDTAKSEEHVVFRKSTGHGAWEIVDGWSGYENTFEDGNQSLNFDQSEKAALYQGLEDAWGLAACIMPEALLEMQYTARYLSPIQSMSPAAVQPSFSSPSLPGVIFVGTHDSERKTFEFDRLAESCVHEHLHNRLYLLDEAIPLTETASNERLYYSPWKKTGRPVAGMLHAIYVFSNLAWFWNEVAMRLDCPIPQRTAEMRRNRQAIPLHEAIQTISGASELTLAGNAVLDFARRISIELGFR